MASSRLQAVSKSISQNSSYVESSINYLNMAEEYLTKEENQFRQNIREFLNKEIAPTINYYVDKAEYPTKLIAKLKEANFFKHFVKSPYGSGTLSLMAQGFMLAELSRVDLGIGTFALLVVDLVLQTFLELASEQQIKQYVPKIRDLDLIGGWCLTERDYGSDASSIQSKVNKVEGGYILNGNKRWIGNGNKDFLLVWARNMSDNEKIQCFIVDLKFKGVTSNVIQHKLGMRIVNNCQIEFDNVFIPNENKLEKATDFQKSTSKILLHSRVFVCWLTFGLCQGVYDNVAKYIQERKQFGVPIASFQLIQEKLARIMSNTQSILQVCWRLTDLLQKGKISMGQAAMGKAWITERTREISRLGREMMGGNGIIADNYAMKAITDSEITFTYEGTYDINSLIAARELTGISAFKVNKSR